MSKSWIIVFLVSSILSMLGCGAGGNDTASSSDSVISSSASSSSSVASIPPGIEVNDEGQFISAVASAQAGDVIYLRGGRYYFSQTIRLTASGTQNSHIQLRAYPGDDQRPVLDFSAMAESSVNRGLILSGDYWHLYGLDIFKSGDNCLNISGSNNIVEFSTFSECADTGLQLGGGASDNLILNCDSYYNADSTVENADGFAAKLDVGSGNRFVGCRAWNNLDDGWDGYLRGADNVTTTYENCWAFRNGYLKSGAAGGGNGNGFKTGGSDNKLLSHNVTFKQCLAAGNLVDGFDHNSNRGSIVILNSTAHANGANYNFSSTNPAASLTIKNSISFAANDSFNANSVTLENNSWQNGESAVSGDFVSIDIDQLSAPRKADGSLPDIDYMHLAPGSSLIDAGADVGLPFNGSAPDLGAFEAD